MKRLCYEGSVIPALGDGEKEIEDTSAEWVQKKTGAARIGKDPARNHDKKSVEVRG